jgi:regulator of nucleoside diphosphate kinase
MRFAKLPAMARKYREATHAIGTWRQPPIDNPPVITIDDRRRLGSLLADDDLCLHLEGKRELEERLDDAVYVEWQEAPGTLVTMNTTVELADPRSGESEVLTLAYPDEAEFIDDSVSVLEPLGGALLGSAVGDVIQCAQGRGTTKFRIRRIVYQPEQASTASPR